MAKTHPRRIVTYPREGTYNRVVNLAEKQGVSVSSIVRDALSSYVNKENSVK